ncbi:electron transfer flavoprotein beta subunit lysine methyltransferase [Aplysia californica]|uniref:ETFB lysine methyltransferase n=1 Tax=Aplysia californica TaxID=6500 RepID=A0ABM0JHT2_APLCA|nr:electron transfer flavoprotein beta subunit lysine methyltransferase [Aplysia californica]XP_005093966.1 electron transfer flavoprotein beta subunit lysine methyltransferase [Aplysia californica]XP_035824531.1 electron transfer flavoprotein beta subunit lysine methyltransferase [Aplysia californica]
MNRLFLQAMVKQHTKVTRVHLTPEVGLHLITPQCHLWRSPGESSPFDDPFWAFYWPGGQALTRYILDRPKCVQNKCVLDIGSGCGSAAIAAKMSGASHVLANDVDPVASVAIDLNMRENSVKLDINTKNLLSAKPSGAANVVLMGDMFYDPDFAQMIVWWLQHLSPDTTVLIGDPDRLPFVNHPMKKFLHLVADYELPQDCRLENNGLTQGKVWMYKAS